MAHPGRGVVDLASGRVRSKYHAEVDQQDVAVVDERAEAARGVAMEHNIHELDAMLEEVRT